MRRATIGLILVLGAASAWWGQPVSGQASSPATLFEGARLIDGRGGPPIESAALLIEGNTIRRVGATGAVAAPPGTVRVDVTGKTIVPGLVSLHGHVGYLAGTTFEASNYTRANIVDHLNRYLYHGVVAMMSTGTDPGDVPYALRNEPHPGALFRTAGRGIAAPNASTGTLATAMRGAAYGATTVAEGRSVVRELAGHRPDFVKIWVDDRNGTVPKLSPPVYRAIINDAHRRGLRVMAHVYYLADARLLVEAGVDGFLHLVRDEEMDDALVTRMKARGVFVTPNLATSEAGTYERAPAWLDDPMLAETATAAMRRQVAEVYAARASQPPPRAAQRSYAKQRRSLERLNAAGVTIALGNDTGIANTFFGFGELRELELMVAAGMTPMQTIVAATSTPARLLRLDRLGALTPGKSATFVVLNGNPLDDIANAKRIATVYQEGSAVDRQALRAGWTSQPR